MKYNKNLMNLEKYNSFENLSRKIENYKKSNPQHKLISLGVGDVSKPIIKPVAEAMKKAVDDLTDMKSFKGYGSYNGYVFLKQAILENEYKDFNFSYDEIYISAGAKTDTSSILELFDIDSKILINDIMYPVYQAGAASLNRKVSLLKLNEDNAFVAQVPKESYDIIYICSPNNPIGIAYSKDDLKKWIDYARENKAIILYDNVYSSFIREKNIAKTIYEIEGAKEVAIEFRSFSKDLSFTGVRCSYYIIPKEIDKDINKLWKTRTINRFNGAGYIAQKGATASFSKEAKELIKQNIDEYLSVAKELKAIFKEFSFTVYGGANSPYLWVRAPKDLNSWETFELFLKDLEIIIVPGIIFGTAGDNYFRLSSLISKDDLKEIKKRMQNKFIK